MSRVELLSCRLARITAEQSVNSFTTTSLHEFSQLTRANSVTLRDSGTMLQMSPQSALALPIPPHDDHVRYWERQQIQDELTAIANRPENPWFASGRHYSVNGDQRSLDVR